MVFVLLLLLALVAQGQEAPMLNALPRFVHLDNITYRTNVCDRQELLLNSDLELRDALQGLNLSVAITNYKVPNEDKFFTLSKQNTIKTEDPGLFVVILDELARRAGFEWRNSFAAIDPVSTKDGNKTWTDLLVWETDHFDIAADYWGRSTVRMGLGISFPKGWYDGSIILAQSNTASEDDFSIWAFLLPFDVGVWLLIILAIFFTGLMYFLLERLDVLSDERELESKPNVSIFLASLTFTGHFLYRPATHPARLLSFSWTFWALIISSAYTANLASFLISRNEVEFSVSTLDEAFQAGTPVCVQRFSVMDDVISRKYPGMNLIRKETEGQVFEALRGSLFGSPGCSVALTNYGTFQIYQGNKDVNYDCSLTTEKRVVQSLPSGFATKVDTADKCTSLVSYVLNLHMTEMIIDGFIDVAWENHMSKISSIDCFAREVAQESTSERKSFSLSLRNTAGIFLMHGILLIVALLVAFVDLRKRALSKSKKITKPPSTTSLAAMSVGDFDLKLQEHESNS